MSAENKKEPDIFCAKMSELNCDQRISRVGWCGAAGASGGSVVGLVAGSVAAGAAGTAAGVTAGLFGGGLLCTLFQTYRAVTLPLPAAIQTPAQAPASVEMDRGYVPPSINGSSPS